MTAILDQPFSAPVDTDLVDSLVAQRDAQLARIVQLHDALNDGLSDAVGYFLQADPDHRDRVTHDVDRLFDLGKAVKYLDSVFWQRALDLTDVYEVMPQARKSEWTQQIQERDVAEFTDQNVRDTLGDLLLSRVHFLAEKADGVFRRLSREHVTNVPEGFGKRFIMAGCFSDWGSPDWDAVGYLTDLRDVIGKIMGREQTVGSGPIMEFARGQRRGDWVSVDGNVLRIRCYLKGTMHVEVHPHIAWRLNQLLNELYPAAIPSRFRSKPEHTTDLPEVHDRPLSSPCLAYISNMRPNVSGRDWVAKSSDPSKAARKEAEEVLAMLGGVKTGEGWVFDYDAHEVIGEIRASGVVPDQVSHQFYPTPAHIVESMLEEAGIDTGAQCLEPSAGTGAIADALRDAGCQPTCVEISGLHATILESKGHDVIEADFLEWAEEQDVLLGSFDFVIMNPPYSEGRAMAHVEAAKPLLAPGGRLVALLPSTYQSRNLPGRWAQTFDRFPGTSISVGIYVYDEKEAA